MIVIDPRYTDTAAGREDEWIPIRPGTDAALVAGIAWVLIDENLTSRSSTNTAWATTRKRCRKARQLTVTTKPIFSARAMMARPKRRSGPHASPASQPIASLSLREIGSAKPAYICQGWGPQRQANGELTSRAIAMLPILTGNGDQRR
jgi:Tat-targeted selenate reductase subunit YnfE